MKTFKHLPLILVLLFSIGALPTQACCCCGLHLAHGTTIALGFVSVLTGILGLAGTGGDSLNWVDLDISYENVTLSKNCKTELRFGLEEFSGDFCTDFAKSNVDGSYDTDCSASFCGICDSSGKGAEAMIVFAILTTIASMGTIVWRYQDTMQGIDIGCTPRKIAASISFLIAALFFLLALGTFGSCITRIQEYEDDLSEDPTSAESSVSSGAGLDLIITAWILTLIAAGNQCCVVPYVTEQNIHGDVQLQRQAGPRPGEVVTAVPVQPGEVALEGQPSQTSDSKQALVAHAEIGSA